MGIEDLTQFELLEGILSLIYLIVGLLVGITISSKYIKYKRKELLFVGTTLAMLTLPFLAMGLSFLGIIFFDTPLPNTIYFILLLGLGGFLMITWMWAMAILLAPDHIKKIVGIYSVISLTYEVYILYMLIMNPSAIVVRVSAMNADYVSPIISLFTLFQLFSVLITILLFVRDCLRSGNPRIIWKGRFLLVSTIILIISTIMVILHFTDIVFILIIRSLFIARMIFSYLGWILPERVAKILIKETD